MTTLALGAIGQKLRRLRKERGLTQTDAARQLNITKQTISQWEQGGALPRIHNLTAISTLYGIEPSALFSAVPVETAPSDKIHARVACTAVVLPILDMSQVLRAPSETQKMRFRATGSDMPADAFFVELNDDANTPRFLPGDLVAFAPLLEPQPGQMILARVKDRPHFRRYLPLATETIEGTILQADNSRWPKVIMKSSDAILGTMVEHVSFHHG